MAEGERRREGSQRSAVEMQLLRPMYICVCVNVCLFEEEKACLRQVFVSLDVCALVCRVRETGQRVKVIML